MARTVNYKPVYLARDSEQLDLVVFSDSFCPHCHTLWQQRDSLVDRYGDQLRIVYKHFPIEKSCNSRVAMTLHPRACEAAYGMEAARRQGQFWAYHDARSDTR